MMEENVENTGTIPIGELPDARGVRDIVAMARTRKAFGRSCLLRARSFGERKSFIQTAECFIRKMRHCNPRVQDCA